MEVSLLYPWPQYHYSSVHFHRDGNVWSLPNSDCFRSSYLEVKFLLGGQRTFWCCCCVLLGSLLILLHRGCFDVQLRPDRQCRVSVLWLGSRCRRCKLLILAAVGICCEVEHYSSGSFTLTHFLSIQISPSWHIASLQKSVDSLSVVCPEAFSILSARLFRGKSEMWTRLFVWKWNEAQDFVQAILSAEQPAHCRL